MPNYGLLAGIANGLREGFGAYRDERRYQDDKNKDEKLYRAGLLQHGLEEGPDGQLGLSRFEKEKRDIDISDKETQRKISLFNALTEGQKVSSGGQGLIKDLVSGKSGGRGLLGDVGSPPANSGGVELSFAPPKGLLSRSERDLDQFKKKEQIKQEVQSDAKKAEEIKKKKSSVLELQEREANILKTIDELEKMIGEKGTYELFGSHNQDLDRKVDQVATDTAKLMDPDSVARPNEVEMAKRGLVTSGPLQRDSTAISALKNFKNEVQNRVLNAYKVRGIVPDGVEEADWNALSDSGKLQILGAMRAKRS